MKTPSGSLNQSLVALDVDGTLETAGGPVELADLAELPFWGILSSRSIERAAETLKRRTHLVLEPMFIEVCRVDMRKEELTYLKSEYPGYARYIYVADREVDRSEALAAGWEFCFAHKFKDLIKEA
jgi:hypothetical protein